MWTTDLPTLIWDSIVAAVIQASLPIKSLLEEKSAESSTR